MEIKQGVEALVHDGIAVAKFIGERVVGGAFASLANIVLQEQPDESNIIKGQE